MRCAGKISPASPPFLLWAHTGELFSASRWQPLGSGFPLVLRAHGVLTVQKQLGTKMGGLLPIVLCAHTGKQFGISWQPCGGLAAFSPAFLETEWQIFRAFWSALKLFLAAIIMWRAMCKYKHRGKDDFTSKWRVTRDCTNLPWTIVAFATISTTNYRKWKMAGSFVYSITSCHIIPHVSRVSKVLRQPISFL